MMESETHDTENSLPITEESKRPRRSRWAVIGLVAGLVAVLGGALVALSGDESASAESAHEHMRFAREEGALSGSTDEGRSGPIRDGRRREIRERIAGRIQERMGDMELLERGHAVRKSLLATAAEALGIEAEELAAELRSGNSIADVATAKDVPVQDVIDALVAKITDTATERITDLVNRKPPHAEE